MTITKNYMRQSHLIGLCLLLSKGTWIFLIYAYNLIQYRIRKGELIGEGAFGKVFSAFDEDRGMLIAMKQIDIKKLKKKSENVNEKLIFLILFLYIIFLILSKNSFF